MWVPSTRTHKGCPYEIREMRLQENESQIAQCLNEQPMGEEPQTFESKR